MNVKYILRSILGIIFATMLLAFAACSDDDPKQEEVTRRTPGINNVFPYGIPTFMSGPLLERYAWYELNDSNQVVNFYLYPNKTVDRTVFQYRDTTIEGRGDFQIYKYTVGTNNMYGEALERKHLFIRLNDRGFAEYVYTPDNTVYGSPAAEVSRSTLGDYEIYFEYNENDQLTKVISIFEAGPSTSEYTLNYENGDLVSATSSYRDAHDDQFHQIKNLKFFYTNEKHPSKLENKYGVLLDNIISNCIIEPHLIELYYAGLLGKSTRNMVVKIDYNNRTEDLDIEFDAEGRPLKYGSAKFKW